MILPIYLYGSDVLRNENKDADLQDKEGIAKLISDMRETLKVADGCGLAAPQVGVLRRIAVIEVEEGKVFELINPKIISFSGEQRAEEGCLSNPGAYGITKRPKYVKVRAMDRHGNTYDLEGEDLLARAICHECDHLNGKLYTDVVIKEKE